MLAACRADTTLESGKFRELVDSKLHHQEGVRQRRQTWQPRNTEEIHQSKVRVVKALKHEFTSIVHRCQEDEKYRASQFEHLRDEEYCKELDKFALEGDL